MKIKPGDIVQAAGYKAHRRVKAVDGKYIYVNGIGWGLARDAKLIGIKMIGKGEEK